MARSSIEKYISQAEEAWEEGYSVTVTKLNELLSVVAPQFRLEVNKPERNWSLQQCRTRLLDCLRPIRSDLAEPLAEEKDVIPRTIGTLGAVRRMWLIAINAELEEVVEAHKTLIWSAGEWQRELLMPVEEHALGWRKWFLDIREQLGCSNIPEWDRATEARNKWNYGECCKGTVYSTIISRLKRKPKSWLRITTISGIKKRAIAYAERYDLPMPPKRISGRPKKHR